MASDSASSSGRKNWPTVEEQLKESRVIAGSALEKLIRENQDFSVLRPEELNDKIRIPLWLRVQFRKRHPEATSKPGDPTGGYPLALRDLYIWMIENQDLVTGKASARSQDDSHGD
jgi:hypothetical protein